MVETQWLQGAVARFGRASKEKLAGPGDREAAIRSPLEALLSAAGEQLRVHAVFHDEVRDQERQVRPDYGVSVGGAISGYVEAKAPGMSVDPDSFTGHNLRQWQRQRDLPNLVYTNGTEWRLYRDGELHQGPIYLTGGTLADAGEELTAPPDLETLLTDFLRWKPAPITSVGALVRAVAPLTRLLRGEVLDQLAAEHEAVRAGAREWQQPFLGLARDWRNLLFPTADDETFADGYAQTVTFALLLARTENITLTGQSLHGVGKQLSSQHSLMGRALQLLTNDVVAEFKVTLDLLVRLIDAVQWDRIHRGRRDAYLHLYEHFLEAYDHELRKKSGSYYTPREVVQEMVRLCEDVLTSRLNKPRAFEDPDVFTVDPAMGTGTYLHTTLERIAERTAESDGPGAVAGTLTQAADRVAGFEIQMGPYAVAELRATDLLSSHGAAIPRDGLNLYVTDTLDDPTAAETQIGSGLQLIAQSRQRANEVKARTNVTVVVGNPPYRERATGMGGWVEVGSGAAGANASGILDDWRDPATVRHFHNLKNLWTYFWRWSTWKVWESTPALDDGEAGIICLITPSAYIAGPGYTGMREYLRRHASEGWIIDLTPEGQTPAVPTRIFPGVRQPLSIGLFVRHPDVDPDAPATIHYRALHGRRAEKFKALRSIRLDDAEWQRARTAWTAPLTPTAGASWDDYPALGDLLPWTSPGVTGNRRWPYAPSIRILEDRWSALQAEEDSVARRRLFKETDSRGLDRLPVKKLTATAADKPLTRDRGPMLDPVRVGYRAFDRQWILADIRVLDRPRLDLWAARSPAQVFMIEQHSDVIDSGPGVVFSGYLPDLHHFNNRGGRVLPLLHPNGKGNIAPGVLAALTDQLGRNVSSQDLLAYVAGIVAHPAYTATFQEELSTPGIRVPITADGELFARAVALGEQVIWVHTYGETYTSDSRPHGTVRYPRGDARQPLSQTAITTMPTDVRYDEQRQRLSLGDGELGPVPPAVWEYTVGGRSVIESWVAYRKADPGGKKTSPLDDMHTDTWDSDWTREFIDLLTVLSRLVELEGDQASLLAEVLTLPTIDVAALTDTGVDWPATARDRKPDYSARQSEITLDL
ncbi:MAG: type ISP restriction/modification enzyme [Brachybacterium sp.]